MLTSDDVLETEGNRTGAKKPTCKELKSSFQLCEDWSISNVDVGYTDTDFMNLTNYKLFGQHIRPVIAAKHPKLPMAKVMALIAAKWREFCEVKEKRERKKEIKENAMENVEESDRDDSFRNESEVSGRTRRRANAVKKNVDEIHPDDIDEEEEEDVDCKRSRGKRVAPLKIKLSNNNSGSESGLRRTKRVKKRKRQDEDSFNDSDAEFEAMLEEGRSADEECARKKRSKRPRTSKSIPQRLNRPAADGYETDHQDYCEACGQGGEILLCDTCPRAFHLVCVDPEAENPPEGDWSCPICIKEGFSKKEDEDHHMEYCRVCRDGGELLCCDRCPNSYHMHCIIPRVSTVPEGDWFCPRCMVAPPKVSVKKILSWRWRTIPASAESAGPEDSEYQFKLEPTVVDPITKEAKIRELFVKYDGLSYWHCEWIPELVLEVHQSILWRCYWKKVTDHDNPPKVEIDADEEESGRWNPCLERKFYRYGVRPEWLTVHRIINHKKERTGEVYFLVKWRDLGYDMATYEPEEGEFSNEIADWSKHINDYWKLRARADGGHGGGKSLKRKFEDDDEEPLGDPRKKYDKQPEYIDKVGGTLHEYQLEGLNWLRFSWSQGTDVILADEMGLGKTVQTISFLYSLYKENLCHGPFLISAPLSTIINWDREFEFWAPDMYVVTYTGDRESRSVIRKHEFCHEEDAIRSGPKACKVKLGSHVKFHVLLTSYELICVDSACLSSVDWEILVVDEAHRLKNNQSKFFRTLSEFSIKRKVLLTGTPLQNNLEELYHLLNFLSPSNFNDMTGFLQEFSDISKDNQVKKLHEMLGPHLLRRLKSDVLKNMPTKSEFIVRIEPSPMQKKYYQYIIHKNYEVLSTKSGGGQTSLLNVVMELKKCCNHPYLLVAAAAEAPLTKNGQYEGNALIKACGKLELLSKMLPKLKASGHRVLIFSQMTKMMDIMEDFLDFMGYKYERIDGKITGPERQDAIDRFNAAGAEQFVFILSTRSGGLGINLATADTVIIYDSDWNPHNDIQAFSRAHRIGQQNKVMIYRFVTRETVEERICQVAKRKMMLTHLIVRPGVGRGQNMSKKELEDILRFGTENLFKPGTEKDEDDKCLIHYDDEAIDRLLDRSQQGIEEKECGLNEYLSSFKVASYLIKDDAEEDVADKEEESDGYWEKLLGDQHTQLMEDEARNWGKGKRSRRQVNYAVPANDESWTDQVSECNSELSPSIGNDGEDEDADFDERNESRRKKGGKEKMLPPLIFKINGNTEILGFNARQRKAFLNAVMRFGLPPNDVYSSQWLVRDLRQKSEKEFRAYVSLFMRHLCESSTDGAETFHDGVPREGLSRQQVLSRIGVMSLVRKKVHEYEAANGLWSMPEMAPLDNPVLCQGFVKQDTSDDNSSPKNHLTNTNATSDANHKTENESSMDVDDSDTKAENGVKPIDNVEGKSNQNQQNSPRTTRPPLKVKFNIADGGFTDIHGLWNGEEKIINHQNEREIWHRSHDYWLLAGVVTHGYGRWQDIQSDPRFALINEPFMRESGKGNFLEMKNKFLARRYKVLEQALVVEEQLRRAVFLNILSQSNNSAINLLQRHADLECIAECHQHLTKENLSENRSANVVLHKVLSQLEELLMEMKSEVNKLPSTLARLAPVTDRLQMSEKSILSTLNVPSQQSNDAVNGSSAALTNPYLSYPYYVGPFAYPPLSSISKQSAHVSAAAQNNCGLDVQDENSGKNSNKNGRDVVIID